MSRVTDADPHLSLRPRPTAGPDLARLAAQARRDLAALAHPAAAWVRPVSDPSGQHIFDVVRRNYILRQFAIQVVIRQKFLVSTQLQQSIHHVIPIFFFNSHDYFVPV